MPKKAKDTPLEQMLIPNYLSEICGRQDINQKKLSELTGITTQEIFRYWHGEREIPKAYMDKMRLALRISSDEILYGENSKKADDTVNNVVFSMLGTLIYIIAKEHAIKPEVLKTAFSEVGRGYARDKQETGVKMTAGILRCIEEGLPEMAPPDFLRTLLSPDNQT